MLSHNLEYHNENSIQISITLISNLILARRLSDFFKLCSPDVETVRSLLNPEEVANKTVPRHVFTKLKQELQEKNEAISTLNHKVTHLESLMKLKDQRISDLTIQITSPPESTINGKSHLLSSGIPRSRNAKI